MINNNIFPQLQSGYCSHHSTETALLKVKNNLLMNMEESRVSLLLLLDLSAAIDTVDHGIFLQSLQKKTRCLWYCSFLVKIVLGTEISKNLHKGDALTAVWLKMWCPSRFLSRTALFTNYTQELFSILGSRFPTPHAYAHNTQLCLSFSPNVSTREADDVTAIKNCIQDTSQMMCKKKLLLNDDKTELLLVGSCNQVAKESTDGVRVSDYTYVLCHQSVIWARG